MPEIRFYHLTQRRLEEALPNLVEQSLKRGWRAVVQTASARVAALLDDALWTCRPESFLPHGTGSDEAPDTLPVYLTAASENPNRADVRFFVEGVRAAPVLADPELAPRERTVIVFDEADIEASRLQWTELLPLGQKQSYWREDETGRFVLTRERNA